MRAPSILIVTTVVVSALVLGGCGAAPEGAGTWQRASAPDNVVETTEPALTPAGEPTRSAVPSTRPAVRPTPRPTPTRKARPTPPRKPPKVDLPPPPPQGEAPGCPPTHVGTKASTGAVKAALTSAAAIDYWQGVVPPAGMTTSPKVTVPVSLMKAIAWQESGWKSTIIACDGGRGVMQVMPGTAQWMNGRFGTTFDITTLQGNARLGGQYLSWLIVYFGHAYFDSYDLNKVAPVGKGGANLKLRDIVIAAYNVGYGNVENPDDTLGIPNKAYVRSVTALLTSCPCLTY